MKFEDSGLVKDPLVEQAFDYAQDYTLSLAKESMQGYADMIDEEIAEEFEWLEEGLEEGDISEEEYREEKAKLEDYRAQQIKDLTPDDIATGLAMTFQDSCLAPALEIQQYSDASSPALIAAALLSHAARDPVDCRRIEEKFGRAIADLVAERLHIDAYPGAREDNLPAANADVKRLFMAELTQSFRKAASIATKLAPEEKAFMPAMRAEEGFKEARLLWGADKKLDQRLLAVFNQAAQLLSSPYRLEAGQDGKPALIKGTPTKTKPPARSGSRHLGDDGF